MSTQCLDQHEALVEKQVHRLWEEKVACGDRSSHVSTYLYACIELGLNEGIITSRVRLYLEFLFHHFLTLRQRALAYTGRECLPLKISTLHRQFLLLAREGDLDLPTKILHS